MMPHALEVFIHEYRIRFPVGVDMPGVAGPIPKTMEAYEMRGTPTLMLLDRQGRICHHQLGRIGDLRLGALIGQLISEPA
jgi:hypothetical protein